MYLLSLQVEDLSRFLPDMITSSSICRKNYFYTAVLMQVSVNALYKETEDRLNHLQAWSNFRQIKSIWQPKAI